jgi:hypothetical protein
MSLDTAPRAPKPQGGERGVVLQTPMVPMGYIQPLAPNHGSRVWAIRKLPVVTSSFDRGASYSWPHRLLWAYSYMMNENMR